MNMSNVTAMSSILRKKQRSYVTLCYWQHNTTKEKGLAAIPEASRLFYDLGIIKAEGNITSGDAHIAGSCKFDY